MIAYSDQARFLRQSALSSRTGVVDLTQSLVFSRGSRTCVGRTQKGFTTKLSMPVYTAPHF